jgi:hypothetical protein
MVASGCGIRLLSLGLVLSAMRHARQMVLVKLPTGSRSDSQATSSNHRWSADVYSGENPISGRYQLPSRSLPHALSVREVVSFQRVRKQPLPNLGNYNSGSGFQSTQGTKTCLLLDPGQISVGSGMMMLGSLTPLRSRLECDRDGGSMARRKSSEAPELPELQAC